jgi:tRNA(Ile)-lysidine synthase
MENPVERAVTDFFTSLNPHARAVLIAVSGGGDSIALLHLCLRFKACLSIDSIGIAHINHGLRGTESDEDERFVAQLARQASCPFHSHRLTGKTLGDAGVEAWAREGRYRFFGQLCQEHGYTHIATGHTADDQVETVVLNLLRGAGLAGLAGMAPTRPDGVIRPLLRISRLELRAWLQAHNLAWREDATNADTHLKRNWVRHAVLPLLAQGDPALHEHLSALSAHARMFEDHLRPLIDTWINRYVREEAPPGFIIDKAGLAADRFLANEALVRLFKAHDIPVDRPHVDMVGRESGRTTGHLLLPAGWRMYPRKSDILFVKGEPAGPNTAAPFAAQLQVDATTLCNNCSIRIERLERAAIDICYDPANRTVFLDADAVGPDLLYRSIKPDDRFQPLGSGSTRNLTEYLKKRMLSPEERSACGVMIGRDNLIAWIPGVSVSHLVRITDTSMRVLRCSIFLSRQS